MAGNSFGQIFRLTTCGESHGGAVAAIVDGCPYGLELNEAEIQIHLDRRRPGQSNITSPRNEADRVNILSGVFEGKTTGTPILLLAYNQDAKPADYDQLKQVFRPSHADYTYLMKYGHRDHRGSGRASARETWARVAAGSIARKYLSQILGIEIIAYVEQVGQLKADISMSEVTTDLIESNIMRCPDREVAAKMVSLVNSVKQSGDSLGGVIRCIVRNVPVGLGDPVFDKIHADLAKAMLSINAVKGFEIGSGFAGSAMLGSEHNDSLYLHHGKVATITNHAGGVVGGISNGEDIYCRVAFKPVSTISTPQASIDVNHQDAVVIGGGRHDPCVLPRAVVIVESMAALVVLDHYLRFNCYDKPDLE